MGAGVVGTGAPNLAGRSGAEPAIGGRVPVAAGAAGPQHRVLDRGGGGADLLAGHHRAVGGSLGVGVRLLDQRRAGVQLPAPIVELLVHALDRQSVEEGKRVAVRVDTGGCRTIKKKKTALNQYT